MMYLDDFLLVLIFVFTTIDVVVNSTPRFSMWPVRRFYLRWGWVLPILWTGFMAVLLFAPQALSRPSPWWFVLCVGLCIPASAWVWLTNLQYYSVYDRLESDPER